MQHRLSFEIPDTSTACILRVVDTSNYAVDMPVKCIQLAISVPGFSTSVVLDVSSEFNLNLTACDLKIQKTGCGSVFNDIPDGIYVARYSVSPNDIVFVEYNHLRITKQLNRLKQAYCTLDLDNCISSPEKKKELEKVRLASDYLNAAKSMVEICRQSKKGLDLYQKACKMLDTIKCSTC